VTFRQLHEFMAAFVAASPSDPALDRQVIVRVSVPDDDDDEIHMGGLQSAAIDAGCTDEFLLLLDADQEGDDEADQDAP